MNSAVVASIIARHTIQGYTNSLTPRCHWAQVILLPMLRTVMRVLHTAISVVHLRIVIE